MAENGGLRIANCEVANRLLYDSSYKTDCHSRLASLGVTVQASIETRIFDSADREICGKTIRAVENPRLYA